MAGRSGDRPTKRLPSCRHALRQARPDVPRYCRPRCNLHVLVVVGVQSQAQAGLRLEQCQSLLPDVRPLLVAGVRQLAMIRHFRVFDVWCLLDQHQELGGIGLEPWRPLGTTARSRLNTASAAELPQPLDGVDAAVPKRAAAAGKDIPFSTAPTARHRTSSESASAVDAGLLHLPRAWSHIVLNGRSEQFHEVRNCSRFVGEARRIERLSFCQSCCELSRVETRPTKWRGAFDDGRGRL